MTEADVAWALQHARIGFLSPRSEAKAFVVAVGAAAAGVAMLSFFLFVFGAGLFAVLVVNRRIEAKVKRILLAETGRDFHHLTAPHWKIGQP